MGEGQASGRVLDTVAREARSGGRLRLTMDSAHTRAQQTAQFGPVPPPADGWTAVPAGWHIDPRTGGLAETPTAATRLADLRDRLAHGRTAVVERARRALLGPPVKRGRDLDATQFLAWAETGRSVRAMAAVLSELSGSALETLYLRLPSLPAAVRHQVFRAVLQAAERPWRVTGVMLEYRQVSRQLFVEDPQWVHTAVGRRMLARGLGPRTLTMPQDGVAPLSQRLASIRVIALDDALDPAVVTALLQSAEAEWQAIVRAWPVLKRATLGKRGLHAAAGALRLRPELLQFLRTEVEALWTHPALSHEQRQRAAALVCQIKTIEPTVATDATVVPPPPLSGPALWKTLITQEPELMVSYVTTQSPAVWADGLVARDLRALLLHPETAVREAGIRVLAELKAYQDAAAPARSETAPSDAMSLETSAIGAVSVVRVPAVPMPASRRAATGSVRR